MQSVQESKQELEAAIRYAENAISSAKTTIESMEFRQEMAKKQYAEQTGLEKAQEEQIHKLMDESVELKNEIAKLESKMQGQYDDIVVLERRLEEVKTNMALMTDENERLKAEVNALEQPERPTMPVIPKAVAIAIFREGVAHGVAAACTEIDNAPEICIEESEYCGGFEVSFSQDVDLSDHIDTDWMRDKCGDYSEQYVIDALGNLCADNEFECRIHGVDDQEEKNAD
jgi:chromosome segregation ATPase